MEWLKNRTLKQSFFLISASVIGSVAGYLCTIFVQAAASDVLRLTAFPVIPALQASALSVLACFIATCIPLRRIAAMNIVDSIGTVE